MSFFLDTTLGDPICNSEMAPDSAKVANEEAIDSPVGAIGPSGGG